MQLNFPQAPTAVSGIIPWIQSFLKYVNATPFSGIICQSQPTPRVILQSPNGTLYAITVKDDGTLEVLSQDGLPSQL
jgi:hypothetical protein